MIPFSPGFGTPLLDGVHHSGCHVLRMDGLPPGCVLPNGTRLFLWHAQQSVVVNGYHCANQEGVAQVLLCRPTMQELPDNGAVVITAPNKNTLLTLDEVTANIVAGVATSLHDREIAKSLEVVI